MRILRASFDGMSISEDVGLRRSAPKGVKEIAPAFWDRYDATSLFYCSLFDKDKRKLSLFGPPLLNLREFVLGGKFTSEFGSISSPKVRRYGRFDRTDFDCDQEPGQLMFQKDAFSAGIRTDLCDPQAFLNCNLVYTMTQNNDLRWIQDWMIWNQKRHGANALILADNASSAYTADELAEAVASVNGYKVAAIVTVPQSYGPDNFSAIKAGYGEYLQVAVMNALWFRWMSSARAMLNIDIDELVTSADKGSIFDAAVASRLGIVMCSGHWRYATPERAGSGVTHADHFMLKPGDKVCPPKYCLRPGSFASRQTLKVHGVSNFKRMPFVSRDRFSFFHCRNISTSWKYDRGTIDPADLMVDQTTAADLSSVFTP